VRVGRLMPTLIRTRVRARPRNMFSLSMPDAGREREADDIGQAITYLDERMVRLS